MTVLEMSRVDRLEQNFDLAALFPNLSGPFTAADLALVPPRTSPNGSTVWTACGVTAGVATPLFAGPDADSSGAFVVTGSADVWLRVTVGAETDAAKAARITLLGSGTVVAPGPVPPVLSIQGRTGAVTLSAADVGADASGAASAAQAYAIQRGNHTGTQVASTISDLGTAVAADPAVRAALVPRPTGGADGQALVKSGTDVVWGTVAGGGGGAGLPATVVNKTTAYTATAGDFVQADTTTAGFTVTLPAAPAVGALVAVKKIDASANTLTIAPSGGGTIDGDPNATTTTKMAGAIFEHVGSNVWRIVASMTTTGPQGPAGPTGATGATGATGPQGPGFIARGAWAPTTAYAINDIVTNGGQTYRSLTAHTSGASFSGVGTNWELWAAKGADGTGGTISVQDEGSALTARSTINFVGAGVTATDDAANSRTLVTIPGGGGASASTLIRSGFYMTMPGQLSSSAFPQGVLAAMPLLVPACTIDRIGIEVMTAAGAGGVTRLGIYADNGSMAPGSLILDAGTIDTTTTGVKELTISQALTAGFLWFVAVQQVAAAVLRGSVNGPYVISHTAAGLSANNISSIVSIATNNNAALPSTFGTVNGAVISPRILVRAA